jgi:hypothetical protein
MKSYSYSVALCVALWSKASPADSVEGWGPARRTGGGRRPSDAWDWSSPASAREGKRRRDTRDTRPPYGSRAGTALVGEKEGGRRGDRAWEHAPGPMRVEHPIGDRALRGRKRSRISALSRCPPESTGRSTVSARSARRTALAPASRSASMLARRGGESAAEKPTSRATAGRVRYPPQAVQPTSAWSRPGLGLEKCVRAHRWLSASPAGCMVLGKKEPRT